MKSRPAAVWIVGVVAFAVLTVAVMIAGGALPGEVATIRWFQRFGQPIPAFAAAIRVVTGTEGNLVVGIVPAVWLIRRHGRRGAVAVAVCLAAMLVVQPVLKEIVDRDRPSDEQVEVRGEHTSRSYPSGHALGTTAVWGTAAAYASRVGRRPHSLWLGVPIPCTAVASMIEGVHWPTDEVAGVMIGAAAAALAILALDL